MSSRTTASPSERSPVSHRPGDLGGLHPHPRPPREVFQKEKPSAVSALSVETRLSPVSEQSSHPRPVSTVSPRPGDLGGLHPQPRPPQAVFQKEKPAAVSASDENRPSPATEQPSHPRPVSTVSPRPGDLGGLHPQPRPPQAVFGKEKPSAVSASDENRPSSVTEQPSHPRPVSTMSPRPGDLGGLHPQPRPPQAVSQKRTVPPKYEMEVDESSMDKKVGKEKNKLKSILFWGALFFVSILACLILVEAAAFLAAIRQLSVLEQVLLGIPMLIFAGIIIWMMVKIIRLFARFRTSPNISQELRQREKLRENLSRKSGCVQELLCQWLDSLEKEEYSAFLKSIGNEGFIPKIKADAVYLQHKAKTVSNEDFISDCKSLQNQIDEIALKRIRSYAAKAGFAAAMSPFALIDRFIVLSHMSMLLKELLEIYRLRPTRNNTFALLVRMVFHTYLAGITGDVTQSIAEEFTNNLDFVTADVLKKTAGKIAEGAVIYCFVSRIGKAAMNYLQPIAPDKK